MRLVQIGIANVNPTVGAVRSNTDRCIELAASLGAAGASLGVFPEQVVGGYAAEDLVQWHAFVEKQRGELERFAYETRDLPTILALGVTTGVGGDLFNCAAVVHAGQIVALVPKEKLPTYNVFYEARTHSRGTPFGRIETHGTILGDQIFRFDFGVVAFEVCEDLWSPDGPMRRRCYAGAEIVCNLSASPYRAGVLSTRREMIATRASDNQATLIYANLVGANDNLVFDGGGFVNQNGRPIVEAARFVEGVTTAVVDLDRTARCRREATTWRTDVEEMRRTESRTVPVISVTAASVDRSDLAYPAPPAGSTFFLPAPGTKTIAPRDELLDELYDVLALGVADYVRKTGAFKSIGVALSGGRDSMLALMVAFRAATLLRPIELAGAVAQGPQTDDERAVLGQLLHTFYMPSRFSSGGTAKAAEQAARDVGATFQTISIEEGFAREVEATTEMLAGEAEITEITRQNVQARIRGQRMWNWANTSGALFLQTGNMSEKAVGYTTIGGDLMGALAVISNLPKTLVVYLLEYLQEKHRYEGIGLVTAKPAGPELQPNQVGEEELMPFPVLDACFYLFAGEKLSPSELLAALVPMFPERGPAALKGDVEKFVRLFTQSIYKWVQSPLSLHVGNLDLDRERALQLPVVTKTEW